MAPSAWISCGLRTSRTSGASGPASFCSNDRASISVICTSADLGRAADLVEQIAHVLLHLTRRRQIPNHDAAAQRAGAACGGEAGGGPPGPRAVARRPPGGGVREDH